MTIITNSQGHTILLMESDRYSEDALSIYRTLGPIITWDGNKSIPFEDVTILVVRLGYLIDAEFLSRFPKLRYLVSPTTGLNHIDRKTCIDRGIHIVSLKDETAFLRSITSTAEYSIGLMLALLRRIPEASRSVVEEHGWVRDRFVSRQLSSVVVGIVGLGRIGRQVSFFLDCLGVDEIRFYDIEMPLGSVRNSRAIASSSLWELFSTSDIVSIHADYREENYHLVNADVLANAKAGMLLINTARGELVDERAVVAALSDRRLGGAAVDVLESEQYGKHIDASPLVSYARRNENVIITPHIGGCTYDAMTATEYLVAQRLSQILGRT